MRKEKRLLLPLAYDEESEFQRIQLQRVLVIPVRIERKKKHGAKSKRGVFVLIFGYGEKIEPETKDLIVVWNERNGKLDFLPFVERVLAKPKREKEYEISEAANQKVIIILRTFQSKVKSLPINERIIIPYSVEGIKKAVTQGGFWNNSLPNTFDHSLREKYMKAALLKVLIAPKNNLRPLSKEGNLVVPLLPIRLQGEGIFLVNDFLKAFKKSSFLLLRDIFNEKYQFDSTLIPDPYSIVRSFLKFIGIYPGRQGGQRRRSRYSNNEQEVIKDSVKQYKKDGIKKTIREICQEQSYSSPSLYQSRKLKK